jgi:hypothetical protein
MMFGHFFEGVVLAVVYAAAVYFVARKRRVEPWPWTIGTLIPFVGLIVSAVFFYLTLLSILDRLNLLEAGRPPAQAPELPGGPAQPA